MKNKKNKPELSTLTIEEILPDNFENLSTRRQKEIIANMIITVFKQAMDCIEYEYKSKEAVKKLTLEVKRSPAAIKLASLKKDIKRHSDTGKQLLEQYNGMKRIAVALGINEKKLIPMEIKSKDQDEDNNYNLTYNE